MPKAEVGTPKYVANQMKSKGLQRLRWYCQICEKQCRDENGFKCHTQSESHVRNALKVGENPNKTIDQYSQQFKKDFLRLLRTGHSEKMINANKFYQEYIRDKSHIHMNATKWHTLTEFVKYLGKEGICKVEETEKDGICIGYIDNSPEALKRKDALRAKEKSEKGDEELSQMILQKQVDQAQKAATEMKDGEEENKNTELNREESKPVQLSLGLPKKQKATEESKPEKKSISGNVFSRMKTDSKVTKKQPTTNKRPMNAFERVMMKDQKMK